MASAAPLLEQTPAPRGPRTVANLRVEGAPSSRFGAGRRLAATFAVLAVAGAAAAVVYRRGPFPWHRRATAAPAPVAPTPPPPTEAELRARRLREAAAEVERALAGELDHARVGAIKETLARLRADGGAATAQDLLARSTAALVKAGEAAFDAGDLDAGIARYQLASELDAEGEGVTGVLSRAIQRRSEAARDAGNPDEALRWARALVTVDAGDAAAHGRLAAALAATDQDDEASAEYKKALAAFPDDPGLTHGLALVERRLAADRRHHRPARGERRALGAGPGSAATAEAAAAADRDEPQKSPASAPAEPAAEQQ
jgi:tetratricopeptide (TPR) repeat protein